MKRISFKSILMLSLGAAIVGFAACSKDDNGPGLTTGQQSLTKAPWKLVTATMPNKAGTDSSILSVNPTGDAFTFGTNGVYAFTDGGAKSDSSVIRYGTGYWALKNTNDSLQLSVSATQAKYWKILKLNDSAFQAQYFDSTVLKTKTYNFTH